jgi:hypothetical protein
MERPVDMDFIYSKMFGVHVQVDEVADGDFVATTQDNRFNAKGTSQSQALVALQQKMLEYWTNPQLNPYDPNV